jgi:hypothetical protein
MSKIVAFGRRKLVGKDTVAKFLKTILVMRYPGINVQIVGFADKVKEISFELYSWSGLQPGWFYESGEEGSKLKDVILPKIGKSPRQIWIGVGNGLRANVCEETWVHFVLNCIKADVILVKDLRFPTEANAIVKSGGYVIEIDKPDVPDIDDGADESLRNYDQWFERIINDKTYADLYQKVLELSRRIWM